MPSRHPARRRTSSAQSPATGEGASASRVRLTVLAVSCLLLATTGCTRACDDEGSATSGKQPSAQSTSNSPVATARQQFEDVIADRSATLSTDGLPEAAPKGFTQADVETFADQIVTIVERSLSPDVQAKTAENAINHVLQNQYAGTVSDYKATMKKAAGNLDWQFVLVSLFDTPPTEPARILSTRWEVDTGRGTLYDGTPAPFLIVRLETFIGHDVPIIDQPGETAPVAVKRTISMSGFRPQGGESWWPGLRTSATSYGDDGCSLRRNAILKPADKPAVINDARKRITKDLAEDHIVVESKASTPRSLLKAIRKNCGSGAKTP